MCFLYRQSISIVYESKFKYIYRYFIKIDRCFCEILQSLPLRKCGLKSSGKLTDVWQFSHFPCGSVDWNVSDRKEQLRRYVTSLAEVWIEIKMNRVEKLNEERHFPCGSVDWNLFRRKVSFKSCSHFPCGSVDWNFLLLCIFWHLSSHFPCGSVDWNNGNQELAQEHLLSLPLRKCGLKLERIIYIHQNTLSLPLRKCGLK